MRRMKLRDVALLALFFLYFKMVDGSEGAHSCCLRLIIILNQERTTHLGLDGVPAVFAAAVLEQAAPILTTGAVLADFVMRKKNLEYKMVFCKQEEKTKFTQALSCINCRAWLQRAVLDAYANGEKHNEYGILLQQWKLLKLNKYVEELIEYYLWTQISFDSSQWYLTRGKGDLDSLFLLIPRSMARSTNNNRISRESLDALGFNPQVFADVDLDTLEKLTIFSEFGDDEKHWPIGDIRKCFKPRSSLWNIYLTGHGLPRAHQEYDSLVAGISSEQFRNLLRFFHGGVSTHFLYYITCFGSGNNLAFLFDDLFGAQKENVTLNYTVASGTTTDLPADGFCFTRFLFPSRNEIIAARQCSSYRDNVLFCPDVLQNVISPCDFNRFFSLLDVVAKKGNNGHEACLCDWENVLRSVFGGLNNSRLTGLRTTPLLRVAGSDDFEAIPLEEHITLLTNSIVQECELRHRLIEFENERVLFVYPAVVMVPFVIKGSFLPLILSLCPDPMLHYFSVLFLTDATVEDFFLTQYNPRLRLASNKIFVIGKVVANSKHRELTVLHDVVISHDADQTVMVGKRGNKFFKSNNFYTDQKLVPITAGEYSGAVKTWLSRLEKIRFALKSKERKSVFCAPDWPKSFYDVQEFVYSILLYPSVDDLKYCLWMDMLYGAFYACHDCKYRSFQYASSWYQKNVINMFVDGALS